MTSSRGMASTFSSSSMIVSGSADGRSILLRTGISVSPSRTARWTLASVWASIPWLASTTRIAPSQACRLWLTSYAKSTCPGRVDQVEAVGQAVAGQVLQAHGPGLDGDPLLALQVHRIEDLAGHLAGIDRVGHLQQPVGERGLPVVDVGDDAEVAQAGLGDGHEAAV